MGSLFCVVPNLELGKKGGGKGEKETEAQFPSLEEEPPSHYSPFPVPKKKGGALGNSNNGLPFPSSISLSQLGLYFSFAAFLQKKSKHVNKKNCHLFFVGGEVTCSLVLRIFEEHFLVIPALWHSPENKEFPPPLTTSCQKRQLVRRHVGHFLVHFLLQPASLMFSFLFPPFLAQKHTGLPQTDKGKNFHKK